MPNVELLFRVDQDNLPEFEAARKVWGDQCKRFRSEVSSDTFVIGRYSVLPFYEDLQKELKLRNSRLINTPKAHRSIAEMRWYRSISELTPTTWFNHGWANVPDSETGYVVKGRTNSRKHKWSSHMFAPDREALKGVMRRLGNDSLIGDQGLVIRKYVPLKKIEEGINGLPITNEWRFFFWDQELVSSGYYWSIAERAEEYTETPEGAEDIARRAAEALSVRYSFFVVDVGETADGDWIVIEVNDGQQSGLSMIDPEQFYTRLLEISDG